ncbi:uncharacterized protein N7483_011598 [Penicillium malachiteum]|uniref:uncharacterized protein n=1 Tax=Penicillium malachiteum TaxID=1324776 RepID=UPI0025498B03|nr:uncharacterized protein N7483_011598 [Penicillium malachiteum]KAJ5714417.1 hypothetical protein N7483_011598 [Penicillium malachiteum]
MARRRGQVGLVRTDGAWAQFKTPRQALGASIFMTLAGASFLLLCRISLGQSTLIDGETEIAIAGCLFNQLNCTPCIQGSIFQFGHDYDGATQMHKPSGPLALDFNSHFFADSGKVLHVESLESASSTFTNSSGQKKQTKGNNTSSKEYKRSSNAISREREVCFSLQQGKNHQFCTGLGRTTSYLGGGLSAELMLEIISSLPFNESLKLRLVCRRLALLCSVKHLPQSYCRSRFCLGQEADFLFPDFLNSSLSRDRNWTAIFFRVVHTLRDGDRSMMNRKRIRGLLEPIAVLWDCAASFGTGPYGSAVSPEPDEARPDEERLFRFMDDRTAKMDCLSLKVIARFSGQMQTCTKGPLREGCREFHYRTQSLASLPQDSSWK